VSGWGVRQEKWVIFRKYISKLLEFGNCTVARNKLIIMQSYTIFAIEGAIQFLKD
jgi:hypothetical protein